MGGWQYMNNFGELKKELRCIARKSSASPATGFKKVHEAQQKAIVDKSFEK